MKVGDVVKCCTCGMRMTVSRVEGGHVQCVWFDADHELHRADFATTALVLVAE